MYIKHSIVQLYFIKTAKTELFYGTSFFQLSMYCKSVYIHVFSFHSFVILLLEIKFSTQ